MSLPRLLAVDDEVELLGFLSRVLLGRFEVVCATSAEAAWPLVEAGGFALLLADDGLPGERGAALIRRAQARHPTLPTLLTSGHGGASGAQLKKPFDAAELVAAIDAALAQGKGS
ncbi:MAG: response regulator [Myxococcales bacterium]|nr:response regulator [Myxococcales bacterium]